MARRQSKVERFVNECTTSTLEELDLMLDILKGMRGKRLPAKPRSPNKTKVVKPNAQDREPLAAS